MARKSKKQLQQEQQNKNYDELGAEAEIVDEEVANLEAAGAADTKLRDWRDVEKLKEERRLRKLIDDDLIDDLPSAPVTAPLARKR